MISISESVHKIAQEKGLVISPICEHAIRLRCETKKSDAPEEAIKLKCCKCKEIFNDGYLCEEDNKFYCSGCNPLCKLTKMRDNHVHLKIPGYHNEHIDLAKELANEIL